MNCNCNDCETTTSLTIYDGSLDTSTGVTPGDTVNEIITKLTTYIENSSGLIIAAGTGIGVNKVGSTVTITNTAPSTTQTLSIAGNALTLSGGGGTIVIPNTGGTQIQSDWNQSSNVALDYIKNKPSLAGLSQTLTYNSGTGVLGISGGNAVTIPNVIYTAGSNISISGGVISNLAPNIVQSLSIAGNQLTITGANTVTLPTQAYDQLVYVATPTFTLSSFPSNNTFVLATTVLNINLPTATIGALGREITMKIDGRGALINLTGASLKNFAATVTTLNCETACTLKIKVSYDGSNYVWELLSKNDNYPI